MNIHILGAHNCEAQTAKCCSILVDDVLAIDAGSITAALSIEEQQKLNAILLTHEHYDHVKDIPTIALNLFLGKSNGVKVYSSDSVRQTIETHLLNGEVYPKFQELPEAKPTINFNSITPYIPMNIDGYQILAVPVKHNNSTFGYQVSNGDGTAIFYTSDTGPGLSECWEYLSPQLLIIEVTFSNRHSEFAVKTGHLTPDLLYEELVNFSKLKNYLPRIIVVHMCPILEQEIENEIAIVAKSLNSPITLAVEGMQFPVLCSHRAILSQEPVNAV